MEGRPRQFRILVGFSLCSLVALASCGEDDNFLDIDKEISANAQFAGSLDVDLRILGQGLALTQPVGERDAERITVVSSGDSGMVTGTFSADSAMMTLNEGSTVAIATTDPVNGAPESFTVTVEEAIPFQEQFPMLGEYIPLGGSFTLTGNGETVAVTFLDSSSCAAVNLSLNGAPAVTRDFLDFEDTVGSPAPSWEEKASLSFTVLYLLVEQAFFIYDTSSLIEAYKGYLSCNGDMTFVCDSVNPQGVPNPAQPDATSTLSWIDANGNGNVDSGDSFSWLIFTCWEHDARRELNDFLDGVVNLSGYIMEREQSGGHVLVSRFGFESASDGVPGVGYADFDFVNIREESVGSYFSNPGSCFTMNGGLDMIFSRAGESESGI